MLRVCLILSAFSAPILAQPCMPHYDPLLKALACSVTPINPATNGAVYWDGSSYHSTAAGGAGTLCLTSASGAAPVWGACSGSAATAFSALTTSTNISATMTVGTGSTLTFTGTGVNNANQINGTAIAGLATGMMKVTNGTGVISTGAADTDYQSAVVLNPKAHGMVCDGTTDDSTAAATVASTAGTWLFGPYTCVITNVTLGSNVIWLGNGTTIKTCPVSTCASSASQFTLHLNGSNNSTVSGFKFDYNGVALSMANPVPVRIDNSSGVTFTWNSFTNSGTTRATIGAFIISASSGVYDHNSFDSTIHGPDIFADSSPGANAKLEISYNEGTGSQHNGIVVQRGISGGQVDISHNVMRNITAVDSGAGECGSNTGECGNAIIVYNQSGNITLNGNVADSLTFSCIRNNGSSHVSITGGTCTNFGESGIWFENPGESFSTSATSVTVGTGNLTFTTGSGLGYAYGALIQAVSTGSGAYVQGTVSSYSGTTLVITATVAVGSGAHTDWNISTIGGIGNSVVGVTLDHGGSGINDTNIPVVAGSEPNAINGNVISDMRFSAIHLENGTASGNSITKSAFCFTVGFGGTGYGNLIDSSNSCNRSGIAVAVDKDLSASPINQVRSLNYQSPLNTSLPPVVAMSSSQYLTISGITNANPAVVTTSATPFTPTAGQSIFIYDVYGMSQINGLLCTVGTVSGAAPNYSFPCTNIDSTSFGALGSNPASNQPPVAVLIKNPGGAFTYGLPSVAAVTPTGPFSGTSAPGSVAGNMPQSIFSDTTNLHTYICMAPQLTPPPACTSVAAGQWTQIF